jgi:long-chain acyl-CoA synthetase
VQVSTECASRDSDANFSVSKANLYYQLDSSFARFGSKIAFSAGETRVTYSEFRDLIDAFAARLATGTQYGQRIGIRSNSSINGLAALYACFRIGRTGVFLPVRDPISLSQIVGDARLNAVIDEVGDSPPLSSLRTTGTNQQQQRITAEGADPCIIIYTSGTTANLRKGVLVSHSSIAQCAAFMNEAMAVTEEINEVLLAPIDHLYGFGRCHAVLASGGTLTLPIERLDFGIFDALERGCNALAVVPSILAAIIDVGEESLRRIGGQIRWIQTGAMRLDEKYRRKLLDIFPNARICLHYGLTELMRATFLDLRAHPDKIHTEGKPRPGVSLEIRDDSGRALPPGIEGEIWLSGSGLAMGYTDSISWQSRLRDGWYRTSDIGLLDESGYLIFRGRNDDILKVKGHLVHPAEVEQRLSALITTPYCVVGVNDPIGIRGMVLALCVESDHAIERHRILAHMCAAEAHLIPEYVFAIPKFPRTASGKIKRGELSCLVGSLAVGGK